MLCITLQLLCILCGADRLKQMLVWLQEDLLPGVHVGPEGTEAV